MVRKGKEEVGKEIRRYGRKGEVRKGKEEIEKGRRR